MEGKSGSNQMWGELEKFVKQVEAEEKHTGEARPYIDQIREILIKNINLSTLNTD